MLYVIILCIITLKQHFHLLFFTVYLHLYSINSSLKFEIKAKQLYAASQRVL